MLTKDSSLVGCVELFTAEHHGRAFYAMVDDEGASSLVDAGRNRRRRG